MVVVSKSLYDKMAEQFNLEKAFGKKDISKLTRKQITDKNGHIRNVWVRNGKDIPKPGRGGGKAELKTEKHGNTSKDGSLTVNDVVSFVSHGKELQGKVLGGKGDIVVIDGMGEGSGIRYTVNVSDVKGKVDKYPKKTLEPSTDKKQIPAKDFSARKYKEYSDDPEINSTPEGIKKGFERALAVVPKIKAEGAKKFIAKVYADIEKANKATETVKLHRMSGEGMDAVYTKERFELHEKIINKILSPENIAKASPKNGEKPYFMILGGRGGSGKSTFDKEKNPDSGVYKESECIHVDPDAIKEMLAEESGEGWEGWKARMYHEESSDVSKMVMRRALSMGANVVMDITMSNADVQIEELKQAKKLGYNTGAYYMHVPKQESFCRAMGRYLENPDTKEPDYTGRLVPPDVLLNMTDNEDNFDKVKDFADDWSFYDNFVPFKDKNGKKNNAIKIAQKGE